MSMRSFAASYPTHASTISRYLSGERVPQEHWFLDKLLAIQAAKKGMPVSQGVRDHLVGLQLAALKAAHPHWYKARLVSDELETARTRLNEAERYARSLEERLAERLREIRLLTEQQDSLRAAWDADRVAMDADRARFEEHKARLEDEVGELRDHVVLAQQRSAEAKERYLQLEGDLEHLVALSPGAPEESVTPISRLSTVLKPGYRPRLLFGAGAVGVVIAITAAAVFYGGGGHKFTLGPEVPPVTGYGGTSVLLSANGYAIQNTPSTTQAGDLPLAERPNAQDSQRWVFWYGGNQHNDDPDATIVETFATDGKSTNGQGTVIERDPSGSTHLTHVAYNSNQFWYFHKAQNSWYQITNAQHLCLTVIQADAPLQLRTCNGDPDQRWEFTSIRKGRA